MLFQAYDNHIHGGLLNQQPRAVKLQRRPLVKANTIAAATAAIPELSMTYKPRKLGRTDLVFGLWSEFISRCVHASLQVYVYQLWRVPPWLTHRHTQTDRHTERQLSISYTISLAWWTKKTDKRSSGYCMARKRVRSKQQISCVNTSVENQSDRFTQFP